MSNLTHTKELFVTYVTAGARIHLYRFPDRMVENAINFDADSSIFIQPSCEPLPIATGGKLWDMQYVRKPAEFMIKFAAGGTNIMHTG